MAKGLDVARVCGIVSVKMGPEYFERLQVNIQ